jgi:glycosyltransferase 2 family protein
VLIGASLPWSYRLIGDPHGRLALLFIDFAALAAGGGFLLLGRLHWPWLRNIRAANHLRACSAITNHAIFNRERRVKIAFLSLFIHFQAVVIAWCVVKAIAAPILFSEIFLLVPPVMLITMLPISIAGWGVREASMALTFGYAGLATGEGINVSLLYGAVFFVVGALGGLVWIFSVERTRKRPDSIELTE